MQVLAFLPWWTIAKPTTIGSWRLLPYALDPRYHETMDTTAEAELRRQRKLGIARRILRSYRTSHATAVTSCTLVHPVDQGLLWTVERSESDELGSPARELTELATSLAFAELAERFGRPEPAVDKYCNLAELALYLQGVGDDGHKLVAVPVQHRSGPTTQVHLAKNFREYRPPHATCRERREPNRALVEAVMKSQSAEVRRAVLFFNSANRDDPASPPEYDLVALAAAMQQLLSGGKSIKAQQVGASLAATIPSGQHKLTLAALDLHRPPTGSATNADSIRGCWAREFTEVRGQHAHGNHSPVPGRWSVQEHLLLASVVVPLLVKLKLRDEQLYDLTDEDTARLEVLEILMSTPQSRFGPRRGTWEPCWFWKDVAEQDGSDYPSQVADKLARR